MSRSGPAVMQSEGRANQRTPRTEEQKWIERAVPLAAWLLGTVWSVRAFTRSGLGISGWLAVGILLALLAIPAALAFAWPAHARRIAWVCVSPLALFAAYLPEYLVGNPVSLARSGILLLLVVLLAAVLWQGSAARADKVERSFEARLGWRFRIAFAALMIVYFATITALSLRKLATLGYAGQDLAYFSQIFYTTLHGRLFESNFYQDLLYTRTVHSDFAGHNSPIQFLFVAFYRFWPMPATNLLVRNAMMTLSVVPAYLLARTVLRPRWAMLASFMFLLVPAIFFQNLFEFYPFSLAAFFLMLSFWAFERGFLAGFVLSLIPLLLVREDLVFAVFFFGLLALWRRRSLIWAAVPLALSVCWAVLSWKVVLPHFLMGAPFRSNVCFAHLGNSPAAMIHAVVHRPRTTILTTDNLVYLKQLTSPFVGPLGWLSAAVLGALPSLAINLLGGAGECPTTSIFSQHSVVPTVFLFAGFIGSLAWIHQHAQRRGWSAARWQRATLAVAFALTLADLAFVTYPEQFRELSPNPVAAEAERLAALLPADAPVAVPRYMAPLFANRMSLYMTDDLLDYHHPVPEYIVVDRSFARMRRSPRWRAMYDQVTTTVAHRPDLMLAYESENYLVYRKRSAALAESH